MREHELHIERLETAIENIAFFARPFSSGAVAKKILEKDSRSKNLFAINKAILDLSSAIRRARHMVVDWQDTHTEKPSDCDDD